MGIPGRSPSHLVGYTLQYLRYCVRAYVRYIVRNSGGHVKREVWPGNSPPSTLWVSFTGSPLTDHTARLQAAVLDRYHIERELGRGGMATVYLARDLRHGRYVALKVLHPELAATLGSERFLREIQMAARLQ